MTPAELAKKLNLSIGAVVTHLFGNAAKYRGGRWHIGNIAGEAGESLVIYENSGRFKDFSDPDSQGDSLELLTLKYGSKTEAIKVAYSLLGIAPPMKREKPTNAKSEGKPIKWEAPEKEWTQLTENPKVVDYLVNERKIPLEVLKRVGVKAKDDEWYVFIRKTHDAKPIPCGAFFVNLKRKLVTDKQTGDQKEKKIIKQSDSPLDTLYGHETCERGVTNGKGKTFVVVTGGQIDMLSYRAIGVLNSVSIPAGEGTLKWVEASWDFLREFDEVYLHLDNDATGIKSTEKIAQKIGFERCQRCVLPPYYKDANQAHVDKYDLRQAIENAVEFKPDMLVSAGEIASEAMIILGQGRREDQGIPFLGWTSEESIEWNIRPRELTLVTGRPGHGKSTILYQQVAYLVFIRKEKVFIASLEEDPQVILGLIAIQALAMAHDPTNKKNFKAFTEVMAYLDEYVWFYNYRGRANALDVLKKADYVVRKHGVSHVIFDSIAKTDVNIENNEECNKFVGEICKAMDDTGAHYYCVAHPRKGDGKDKGYAAMVGIDEIKGTAALGIETFNCVTMFKNDAKKVMLNSAKKRADGMFQSKKQVDEHGNHRRISLEEIEAKGDGVIWISKQKVGGKTGRHDVYYNPVCYRFERNKYAESTPYATEIYEKYIGNPNAEPPSF